MGGVFLVNTPSPNRAQARTHNLFFDDKIQFLTLGNIRLNLTEFYLPFFDIHFYPAEIRSTLIEFSSLPAAAPQRLTTRIKPQSLPAVTPIC